MSDIELDKETRAAIEALVWRLQNRGDADDEPFAAEFIAALKARGWRPTPARPAPDWHYRTGGSAPPPEYLKAKAALAARAEGRAVQGEVLRDQAAIEAAAEGAADGGAAPAAGSGDAA